MKFEVRAGPIGLVFLLCVFGIATLVLPAAAVRMIRDRSPWFPFVGGFFLFSLMVDVLCVTQIFTIAIPHRDHLLSGLLVAGFSLCASIWPLMFLRGMGRSLHRGGVPGLVRRLGEEVGMPDRDRGGRVGVPRVGRFSRPLQRLGRSAARRVESAYRMVLTGAALLDGRSTRLQPGREPIAGRGRSTVAPTPSTARPPRPSRRWPVGGQNQ